MIEVKGLTAWYEKEKPILKNMDITVEDGESVALVGANGAGKSTLLAVLLGLLPFTGKVSVLNLPVEKENLRTIRAKVGMLFQNPDDQIFQGSVCEDIAFGPRNYGVPLKTVADRSRDVLRQLGREDLLEGFTYKLSFGEKKIVALAGLLVMEPQLLLMDEPTSALDPRARMQFMHCLGKLPQSKLIATHDLDMVFNICTRVILLDKGKVAAQGVPEKILTDKVLLESHGLELPLCCQNR